MLNNKSFLLIALCAGLLCACAAPPPQAVDYDMTCEDISAEMDKTRAALYEDKAKKGNGSEVAGTVADVAATGAGIAGVPYVGGIYSIGKTILNHRKRTAVNQEDLHQYYLDELEYLAQRKLCDF